MHLKKLEYREKGFFFCNLFQKVKLSHILDSLATCKVSQNIRILPKINIKKGVCKTEKFKFFSFMHSILGQGSFSTNSSISEVWHGSDQPVALLRNYWAFSSSGLLDRPFLIFLLKISHRFHMGFRSGMLAGQSSTVKSWSANHLEVVLALWAGAKVLLHGKVKQHLHKACQQMEA